VNGLNRMKIPARLLPRRSRRTALLLGTTAIVCGTGVAAVVALGGQPAMGGTSQNSTANSSSTHSTPFRATSGPPAGVVAPVERPSAAPSSTSTGTPAVPSNSVTLDSSGGVTWLAAGSIPLADVYHWTWSDVPDPMYQGYVCSHGTFAQLGAVSVEGRSALPSTAADSPYYDEFTAQEQAYSFTSSRAAAEALAKITNGARGCAAIASNATAPGVHQTAVGPRSAAFAVYPTPVTAQGFGGAVRETHEYLAQHGPLIAVVDVVTATSTGTPSQLYLNNVRDQSVLDALTASLSGSAG
jgi:hypothetical protein